MSQVITFYSYKGGVGRSLALVNVATLLSKWGKKVLMIDWDLEAPGLENFFEPYLQDTDWSKQKGILDFLWAKQKKDTAPWKDWVVSFSTKISTAPLHLLVSGKANGDYSDQLRAFNVSQFYKKHDGARVIEDFRNELLAAYDYILIDSRTGVTDFGGICTIQMPDILVMLLTATEQGLSGTARIAEKAQAAHSALPFDREKLLIMPVPARIDQSEYALTQEWLNKIATKLKPYYEDWIPKQIDMNDFMRLIKLPYIPYFSYGEKLPVIEQGVSDPAGLGYAYENLAMLLMRGLDAIDEFFESREIYLARAILSPEKIEQAINEIKANKFKILIIEKATSDAKKGMFDPPDFHLEPPKYGAWGAVIGTFIFPGIGTLLGSIIGNRVSATLGKNEQEKFEEIYSDAYKKAQTELK